MASIPKSLLNFSNKILLKKILSVKLLNMWKKISLFLDGMIVASFSALVRCICGKHFCDSGPFALITLVTIHGGAVVVQHRPLDCAAHFIDNGVGGERRHLYLSRRPEG